MQFLHSRPRVVLKTVNPTEYKATTSNTQHKLHRAVEVKSLLLVWCCGPLTNQPVCSHFSQDKPSHRQVCQKQLLPPTCIIVVLLVHCKFNPRLLIVLIRSDRPFKHLFIFTHFPNVYTVASLGFNFLSLRPFGNHLFIIRRFRCWAVSNSRKVNRLRQWLALSLLIRMMNWHQLYQIRVAFYFLIWALKNNPTLFKQNYSINQVQEINSVGDEHPCLKLELWHKYVFENLFLYISV